MLSAGTSDKQCLKFHHGVKFQETACDSTYEIICETSCNTVMCFDDPANETSASLVNYDRALDYDVGFNVR